MGKPYSNPCKGFKKPFSEACACNCQVLLADRPRGALCVAVNLLDRKSGYGNCGFRALGYTV